MESTKVIGVVQLDGTVLTKGEVGGRPWECEMGHTKAFMSAAGEEWNAGDGPACSLKSHTGPSCALRPVVTVPSSEMMLPTDSAERKEIPITAGVIDYFPLAIAAVARHSKMGNDKHNPGEPLHWAREKSKDHGECMMRHWVDRDAIDPEFKDPHYVGALWRLLAYVQVAEEKRLGKPMSRGSQ